MKPGNRHLLRFAALGLAAALAAPAGRAQSIIVDHTCTNIRTIPEAAIRQAKQTLHIAYGHTSHGSQLVTGMQGLVAFMNRLGATNNLYAFNAGGTNGALDLRDTPFSGAQDLGNPDRTAWAAATRTYLAAHRDVNVVIWSWCGQVSSASEADINTYLNAMAALERDFPAVRFVYMTGHLDGSGETGQLNVRNNQIRTFCRDNGKVLFDFADIESYDPDGATNYMRLRADDACNYDSDGNGSADRNWARAWQTAHTENVDWYNCSAAHSEPLNANRKAYAAWWLWARLAGWSGSTAPAVAPAIATQPAAQSVDQGANVTFTVSATGTAPLSYQWRKDGVAIGGATANSLSLTNVQPAAAGLYSVVVTNSAGSATSNTARLTVAAGTPPAISSQPQALVLPAGYGGTLNVAATGSGTLAYQWCRNGVPIPGATSASYCLTCAQLADGGEYTVTISNGAGSVTSSVARLTVGSNSGRLLAIATRGFVGTGASVLIPGFAFNASSPKTLIIRVVGPGLVAQGVGANEVLADPVLSVRDSKGAEVVASDDWSTAPNAATIVTAAQSVGLAPLEHGSRDAAVLTALPGGAYTVIVSGKNGATGVALVEVYEVP